VGVPAIVQTKPWEARLCAYSSKRPCNGVGPDRTQVRLGKDLVIVPHFQPEGFSLAFLIYLQFPEKHAATGHQRYFPAGLAGFRLPKYKLAVADLVQNSYNLEGSQR